MNFLCVKIIHNTVYEMLIVPYIVIILYTLHI